MTTLGNILIESGEVYIVTAATGLELTVENSKGQSKVVLCGAVAPVPLNDSRYDNKIVCSSTYVAAFENEYGEFPETPSGGIPYKEVWVLLDDNTEAVNLETIIANHKEFKHLYKLKDFLHKHGCDISFYLNPYA